MFSSLFVCKQSSINSNEPILTKFSGQFLNLPRTNPLVFGGDPDHRLDPGLFENINIWSFGIKGVVVIRPYVAQ